MADHSDFLTSEMYDALLARISAVVKDMVKGLDPAIVTATNVPDDAIRWNSASSKWEKYDAGTATWGDLDVSYAINIDGEAGSVAVNGVDTDAIQDDAVSYAKIQNVSATDKLLGRASAGVGNVEEITCTAAARALLDDADAAAMRATLSALTTGDYGLGGSGVNEAANWDNMTASGFYYLAASLTNAPTAAAVNWHCLVMRGANANNVVQIGIPRATSLTMYVRYKNAGTWGAWSTLWTSTNDGAGTGLDADLLDGHEGSYYAAASDLTAYAPVDAGVYGKGLSLLCRTTGALVGAGGTTAGTNLEHLFISTGTIAWTAITAGTWKNVADKTAGPNVATYFQRIS